jgi:hypothetical protein
MDCVTAGKDLCMRSELNRLMSRSLVKKPFAILSTFLIVISCSSTYINFDDNAVLRGTWVAEVSNASGTVSIKLNAKADNANCPCAIPDMDGMGKSDYKISGTIQISSETYPIEGFGSLGAKNFPAAIYAHSFFLKVLSNSSEITKISGTPLSNDYQIYFSIRDATQLEKYRDGAILKKQN